MKIAGFDNDAYVKMQSEKITERIANHRTSATASANSAASCISNSAASSLMTSMPPAYFRASSRTVRL